MCSLEVDSSTVALFKLSLLIPPAYASTAIDAKASPLTIRRGLELAVQASEAVLFFEDTLDVTEQCARIAIAEVLLV